MIIQELYLKSFGKFTDRAFQFDEGINILYGENEFGKSTIHSFIKGMLYGMESNGGKKECNLYEPWEKGECYAGTLCFQCEKRNFVLEREFNKYRKKSSLICKDDGEILSLKQGDLDMLLGNVIGTNYENTASIAQRKVETAEELRAELKKFAANYHSKGDQDIQLEGVRVYLEEKKKVLENSELENQNQSHRKKEKLILERDYMQREKERLELLLKENQKLELLQKPRDKKENTKQQFFYLGVLVLLFLLYTELVIFPSPWNVITASVIILTVGLFIWDKTKHRVTRKNKGLTTEYEKISWEKSRIESELQEKIIILGNIEEEIIELLDQAPKSLENIEQIKAVEFAMERIDAVSQEIQKDFGKELNEGVSNIFAEITGEEQSRVIIDENLDVSLFHHQKHLTLDQVSRGTVEQVYFAIRMALIDILHTEELPILLDDTFAYYDEGRLKQVLKWLHKNKKQVIIFTCHKREQELLNEMQISYYEVK